jgi:hypothetical protein
VPDPDFEQPEYKPDGDDEEWEKEIYYYCYFLVQI